MHFFGGTEMELLFHIPSPKAGESCSHICVLMVTKKAAQQVWATPSHWPLGSGVLVTTKNKSEQTVPLECRKYQEKDREKRYNFLWWQQNLTNLLCNFLFLRNILPFSLPSDITGRLWSGWWVEYDLICHPVLLISATSTERCMGPASSSLKATIAAPLFFSPQAIRKTILIAWVWWGKKECVLRFLPASRSAHINADRWNHIRSPTWCQGNNWMSESPQLRKVEQMRGIEHHTGAGWTPPGLFFVSLL